MSHFKSEFDIFLPWTHKRLERLSKEFISSLLEPVKEVLQDQSELITNLMTLLAVKAGVSVNVTCFSGRALLVSWYKNIGYFQFNIASLLDLISNDLHSKLNEKSLGVNLVGYSLSPIGLGEDVRNIANVLELNDIPFCIINIGHPSGIIDNSYVKYHVIEPKYSTTLFCMNAEELGKLIDSEDDFKARYGYIIAQPPWELSNIPKKWHSILDNIDEVWAISHFVRKAFSTYKQNVIYMPPIVRELNICKKEELKKQIRPFTFLYVFDAASYLARKNPIAVVKAFQKAFVGEDKVRLILKVSNTPSCQEWNELINLCRLDFRIHINSEILDNSSLNQLIVDCDCYISLHRSEGFGRTIAEACFAKKPVISTAWSGSLDIINEKNTLSVGCNLIQVEEGQYPYSEGQLWAEPNAEETIKKLQFIYTCDVSIREEIGESNYLHSMKYFSLKNVENTLLSRLMAIGVI